jgi:hypothetical protein
MVQDSETETATKNKSAESLDIGADCNNCRAMKGTTRMTDSLNKRLEKKDRHDLRSPLAARTPDGRSVVITPPARGTYTLMADPEFWKESGVVKFLWGTDELTASISDFLEATEKYKA